MLTRTLRYGRTTQPLAWVVPYERLPGMWRIHWPDGNISDMLNLARAKDAAIVIANRDPARHNDRLFHWEPVSENARAACADALNAEEATEQPLPLEIAPSTGDRVAPTTDTHEAAE
jgi:hypothetical protein